ncbi:unnamed protein product, partial [Ectocarpus sp. 12 AP-2014]
PQRLEQAGTGVASRLELLKAKSNGRGVFDEGCGGIVGDEDLPGTTNNKRGNEAGGGGNDNEGRPPAEGINKGPTIVPDAPHVGLLSKAGSMRMIGPSGKTSNAGRPTATVPKATQRPIHAGSGHAQTSSKASNWYRVDIRGGSSEGGIKDDGQKNIKRHQRPRTSKGTVRLSSPGRTT